MGHELATALTKWVYTDGCVDEMVGFYLDDRDPDDLMDHVRNVVAERVESAIRGHMLCYDTGPTDEVLMGVVAKVIPHPSPTVTDVRWAMGWLLARPGSPIRPVQVYGEDDIRYVLAEGDDE